MNLEPGLVLCNKIKEEEEYNASNIIDLELDKSPEDLVYEWNSKVRLKFKNYSTIDNEHSLDILMKWYIRTIEEEAVNLEDVHKLKLFTTNHMQFLKLAYLELNCCFVDNYLDSMEEILSFYVNLEVKSVPAKKKDGNKRAYKRALSSICHKIISLLNLYLLKREDRIYQVVMKVKLNSLCEESKDLLNLIYGNFLTKRPRDRSDLGFCRAYILYQKWKTIKGSEEDWEKMDEIMYSLYERTSDSIKSNPVLKQILLPQSNSILDTLTQISENHLIIAKEYFKYIKSNKVQDDNIIMASGMANIDIQEDESAWDSAGDADDPEFESAYKSFVQSMSSVHSEKDRLVTVKVESGSESDDCEIVSVSFAENDPEDIIHEILDDDEDDIEIVYRKKKDEKQKTPKKIEEKSTTLSFLESIEAAHSRDVSTERVSSSTSNGCGDYPPADNLVETLPAVRADSPTSSCRQKQPAEAPSVVSSVTQTEPSQEVGSGLKLNHVLNETERGVTEEKSITAKDTPESNVELKSVASTETQTDEWLAADDQDKLPLEKNTPQDDTPRSYYCYGLDTPPFDQRPDEHISSVTESTSYPNVYVNIVSPNQPTSLAKATDTDSLSSSADDNDKISCLTSNDSDYERKLLDTEFDSNLELGDKKKHKKSKEPLENHPNLLDDAFIPYVKPNTKKKRRKMDEPPEDYPNGLSIAIVPDVAKRKCKVLDKISDNLLDSSMELNKKKKRKKTDVDEPKPKKRRKKSHRQSENGKSSGLEAPRSSMGPRISLDAEENVIFESPLQEMISESATTGEPAPGISTTGYLHAYPEQQTENYDDDVCETSINEPCTSLDFVVTSAESMEIPFNDQTQSYNSPDVTSTSTDVQDFARTDFDQSYDDMLEIEEHGISDVGYCVTVAADEDNGENVTQSNIEDVAEEGISVSEDVVEKTSKHRVTFSEQEEFAEPSVEEFLKVERWSKLKEKHGLDEAFSGPVFKMNEPSSCVDPDGTFDLFSPNFVPQPSNFAGEVKSPAYEMKSPAYEGMEDFRTYYEESRNRASVTEKNIPIVSHPTQETTGMSPNEARSKSAKKVLIGDTIMSSRHSVPQSPINKNVPLRGILKKSVQDTSGMFQKELCVGLKRLSQDFIDRCLSINQIAQEVRLRKLNWEASPAIKVDYSKRSDAVDGESVKTPHPYGLGQWRCGSVGKLDEGLQQLPYTEKKTGKRKSQNIRISYNTPKKGPGRPRKTI